MNRTGPDQSHRLCVAPMMEWTDRHCRYFHRIMTRHARLYTEMLTADAVIHGDRARLLGFSPCEHPVALQLGGSDPVKLARAAGIGAEWGYDEINLNVGCPSDRVQSGRFGACLMTEPALVAECLAAMRDAARVQVTVKCRIGVDDQNPEEVLPAFIERVAAAGVETVVIHARKALLKGLSPKENRDIPPLDYPLVYAMKRAFPHLAIVLNGGVTSLEAARGHLEHVDGVMLGREAYHNPAVLLGVDFLVAGDEPPVASRREAALAMLPYIACERDKGTALFAITRHMLGLYNGLAGARSWRRMLSEGARACGAGPELVHMAVEMVEAARSGSAPAQDRRLVRAS